VGTIAGFSFGRENAVIAIDPSDSDIALKVTGDTPKWTGLDSSNWVVGPTGPNDNWKLINAGTPTNYMSGDVVLFDDSAHTGNVSIPANVTPTSATFNNGTLAYSISSTGTFGIAGAGGVALTGTGTVTIENTNYYTGATNIGAGATLQLGNNTTGNDGSIAGASAVTDNGSLIYNRFGANADSSAISGTGSVTIKGGGSEALSVSSSYSGGTTLSAGTLFINGTNAIGTGTLTIGGGTIDSTVGPTLATNNLQAWNSDFVFGGTAALNLGTGTVTLGSNRIVTTNGANALTVGGVITDNGGSLSLTKAGPGTLIVTGASTYTGGTIVNAGTLQTTVNPGAGTTSLVVNTGATLNLTAGLTFTDTLTGAGTVTMNSTASIPDFGDASGFSGTYFHNSTSGSTAFEPTATTTVGTVTFSNSTSANAAYVMTVSQGSSQGFVMATGGNLTYQMGSLTGTGNANVPLIRGGNSVSGTAILQIGNLNTSTTWNGNINDGGAAVPEILALTKVGTGALTISGADNYSGLTLVNSGTLVASNSTSLGFGGPNPINNSGSTTVGGAGAPATLDLTGATTVNEPINLVGGTGSNTATLTVSSGTTTLSNGVAEVDFVDGGDGATAGGTLVFSSGAAAASFNESGGAASSITVTAAGSGYTTAPTVTYANGGPPFVGTEPVAILSSLSLTGTNINIGGAGTLDIAAAVTDGTASGGFTKIGAGVLSMQGENTYTGVTTLAAGILNLDSAESAGVSGPLGTSAASNPGSIVMLGGTLQFSTLNNNDYSGRFSTATGQQFNIDTDGQAVTFASPLVGAGNTLTLADSLGTGTLTVSSTSTYTGSTTVSGGTLDVTGALADSGTITVGTANLIVAAPAALLSSAAIANNGTASFTASGANTVGTIDGTGTLSVSSGTLTATHIRQASLTIGSGSTVSIADSANPGTTTATSVLNSLSNSGTLNLRNNDLIINDPTQLSAVRAAIDSGYAAGAWNGAGIDSSSAAAHPTSYGLGYATTTELGNPATFDGQNVSGGATIVKYTLLGDTKLRGTVGGGDYNTVLGNFDAASADWSQGNFHNATSGNEVSGADFNAVLANFDATASGSLAQSSLKSALKSTKVSAAVASVSPAGSANDIVLNVNTLTGDISMQATTTMGLTLYNIVDASKTLIKTAALLISKSSTNWQVIKNTSSILAEGQNSTTYNATSSSSFDTIQLTAGQSIDLGDVFNVTSGVKDLTFEFSEPNTNGGDPTTGTTYDGAAVNYVPVPEPTTLGLLGLGGLAMMRRRRRLDQHFAAFVPKSGINELDRV
jgi:autotransporter-associated beta strand protein